MVPNYQLPNPDELIENYPDKSVSIASEILLLFDGIPIQDMKLVMSGLTIALISIMMRVRRKYIIVNKRDGLEKMILRWMAGLDSVSKLNFSHYIKIDEND